MGHFEGGSEAKTGAMEGMVSKSSDVFKTCTK